MSLIKRIFHQISEIPVVAIFLLVILSPIFLAVQIVKTIQNRALNREINLLREIIESVIPRENRIINQIRKIKNPNLSSETKIEITNHLIAIFQKCHPGNRAATEILNHLKKIRTLLSQ